MANRGGSAKVTTDHDFIRRWVEERGGNPASVKRTSRSGVPGIIRIDYPGYSGGTTLEKISWDQFFEKFDDSNLAFLYQEDLPSGDKSRFSKLVGRETVKARLERGEHTNRRALRERSQSRTRRAAAPARGRAKPAPQRKRATASARKAPQPRRATTAKRGTARRRSAA